MSEIKLTDEQFLSVLRSNAGLYAKTAAAISKHFKIPYSRQAVRQRAEQWPDVLRDIAEENLDIAEDGLHDLMKCTNKAVKLKAIETFLKSKGKGRGYFEKIETDNNIKTPAQSEASKKLDMSKLTDDELRTLDTLIEKATA